MNYRFLAQTPLFQGTSPQEIEAMLACLGSDVRRYQRGQIIYRAGDVVHALGTVLSGSVLIEIDDVWGNTTVLDCAGPGHIFAETYACLPDEPLMVHVKAAEACQILFLNVGRVLQICPTSCGHHITLVQNLLALSAQKNLNLSRKIFHTAPKTIRGRLLSYLSDQSVRSRSRSFTIPFNRQQLADYLNVDRSALSNELSKMQREGLLRADRNHFVLLGI